MLYVLTVVREVTILQNPEIQKKSIFNSKEEDGVKVPVEQLRQFSHVIKEARQDLEVQKITPIQSLLKMGFFQPIHKTTLKIGLKLL
jgi:hypothetical protein